MAYKGNKVGKQAGQRHMRKSGNGGVTHSGTMGRGGGSMPPARGTMGTGRKGGYGAKGTMGNK